MRAFPLGGSALSCRGAVQTGRHEDMSVLYDAFAIHR